MSKTPLSMYVHIPFCVSKCIYCDFLSFADYDEGKIGLYVAALCEDIRIFGEGFEDFDVETVFFGGGTPSLLTVAQFRQILDVIQGSFRMESAHLGLEANPDTVDDVYLRSLYQLGFRRISFGVQSFDDAHLVSIGRVHAAQTAINAVYMASDAGFVDINIDLMYSLPNQSLEDFEITLDTALSLPITHISCYALTVEGGTPLGGEQCSSLRDMMPNEDDDRAMFEMAVQKLSDAGFKHYEISNWARPTYGCRHNIGYWTHRQYVGFGISAASFFSNKRWKKTDSLDGYIDGDFAFKLDEELDETALMAEYVMLGLRMMDGISLLDFKIRFGVGLYATALGERLEVFVKNGLLVKNADRLALTQEGMNLSNRIFSDII